MVVLSRSPVTLPPPLRAVLARTLDRQRARTRDRRVAGHALDEAAAEHAGLPVGRVIEYAGLARRDALLAGDELDLEVRPAAEPGALRRPGRAHLDEDLAAALRERGIERILADPADVAQMDAPRDERLARADDHATCRRVQPHHVERRARRDLQPAPLADGEMDDAAVPPEHPAGKIDDLARLGRARPQAFDHLGVAAGLHEEDV